MGKCLADETMPAPWPVATPNDFHRRRPGEPLGYLPVVGDRIRYALRHTAWCSAAGRFVDDHDELGPFDDVVTVTSVHLGDDGRLRVTCLDDSGQYRGIDQDWWLIEHVEEDGALW